MKTIDISFRLEERSLNLMQYIVMALLAKKDLCNEIVLKKEDPVEEMNNNLEIWIADETGKNVAWAFHQFAFAVKTMLEEIEIGEKGINKFFDVAIRSFEKVKSGEYSMKRIEKNGDEN